MASVVSVPAAVRRAIADHARRERPRECCGLLVGRGTRVEFAVPMRNVAEGTTRYRIDDAAHIDLRRAIRSFQPRLEVLGVYHSHPVGPAQPSQTDLDEAMYPEWIHLIVGLERRRVVLRAFRIRQGRALTVAVR